MLRRLTCLLLAVLLLAGCDTQLAPPSPGVEKPAETADVFIMPPSLDELHRRLVKRATETAEQIEIRMQNAAREMKSWRLYRYSIISGSMEEDLQKFRAIMRAERYLSRRLLMDV